MPAAEGETGVEQPAVFDPVPLPHSHLSLASTIRQCGRTCPSHRRVPDTIRSNAAPLHHSPRISARDGGQRHLGCAWQQAWAGVVAAESTCRLRRARSVPGTTAVQACLVHFQRAWHHRRHFKRAWHHRRRHSQTCLAPTSVAPTSGSNLLHTCSHTCLAPTSSGKTSAHVPGTNLFPGTNLLQPLAPTSSHYVLAHVSCSHTCLAPKSLRANTCPAPNSAPTSVAPTSGSNLPRTRAWHQPPPTSSGTNLSTRADVPATMDAHHGCSSKIMRLRWARDPGWHPFTVSYGSLAAAPFRQPACDPLRHLTLTLCRRSCQGCLWACNGNRMPCVNSTKHCCAEIYSLNLGTGKMGDWGCWAPIVRVVRPTELRALSRAVRPPRPAQTWENCQALQLGTME